MPTFWKECLAGVGSHLPSKLPPLDLLELCRAVRVVRLDAEPTQGFAALLDRALHLGTEPVPGQGAGLDAIEPDRSRMADLGLDRKRLLANEESVAELPPPQTLPEHVWPVCVQSTQVAPFVPHLVSPWIWQLPELSQHPPGHAEAQTLPLLSALPSLLPEQLPL